MTLKVSTTTETVYAVGYSVFPIAIARLFCS